MCISAASSLPGTSYVFSHLSAPHSLWLSPPLFGLSGEGDGGGDDLLHCLSCSHRRHAGFSSPLPHLFVLYNTSHLCSALAPCSQESKCALLSALTCLTPGLQAHSLLYISHTQAGGKVVTGEGWGPRLAHSSTLLTHSTVSAYQHVGTIMLYGTISISLALL